MPACERDSLRAEFVRRSGWGNAGESPLAGDASLRKYFRLRRSDASAVVMDAPPSQEDVRPFARIGRHLRALGLSAPEIFAIDEANGFVLLEDLGDGHFAVAYRNSRLPVQEVLQVFHVHVEHAGAGIRDLLDDVLAGADRIKGRLAGNRIAVGGLGDRDHFGGVAVGGLGSGRLLADERLGEGRGGHERNQGGADEADPTHLASP